MDFTISAGVLNEVVDMAKGLFFLIDLLQKFLDLSSKSDNGFVLVVFSRKGSDLGDLVVTAPL